MREGSLPGVEGKIFLRSGEAVGELKRERDRCWLEIIFHSL